MAFDGQDAVACMTPVEEQRLRLRLAPYVAKARVVAPAGSPAPDLRAAMRRARLQALLQLPDQQPEMEFSEEFRRLVDKAAEVYSRSLGETTTATYRRRWTHFCAWCERHGHQPLPASAELVMTYLADLIGGDPPPALNTLRGRVAAINKVHVESDLPVPGDDPVMALMMRGLSRTVPQPPANGSIAALRIADLRDVLRHLAHPDPVVVRDAALLHLSAAGIGVGHLSRLRWGDVTFNENHALLRLRDAYQREPTVTVRVDAAADAKACPVRGLLRWRELAGILPEQVFSAVDRQGRRHPRHMSSSHLRRIVETRTTSLVTPSTRTGAAVAAARLLDQTPSDVLRDRAMLLLGWAGAFRRGEVTRLVWSDVRVVDEGLVVRLRQSKTDTYHRGVEVGIPLGRSLTTCPVRAVLAWKQRMQDQLGAGFDEATTTCWPAIGKAGRIRADRPLSPEGLTMAVKRRTAAAGVAGRFGGRSLRAGFISTAADLELPLELVAAQSRHASLDNLLRYVRADDVFRRNAADRVGL
jgi:integrase